MLIPSAEVDIFIAEEFYVEACKQAWPENIWNWQDFKDSDTIFVRVNEHFKYGQSYYQSRRFLVYHPPARKASQVRPVTQEWCADEVVAKCANVLLSPSQGRFMPNLIKQAIAGLDDIVPEVHPVKMNQKLFRQVSKAAQALFGHELRSFVNVPLLSKEFQQKLGSKLTVKNGFELLDVSEVLKISEGGKDQDVMKQALNTVLHGKETADEQKKMLDSVKEAEKIKEELNDSVQVEADDDVVLNIWDILEHTSGLTGTKIP